ncbi:hypothetical protein [Sphingomonas oryzagri]
MEVADYHDVLPIIRQAERIERLVPRSIMTVFVGLPIFLGLLHGHPILGFVNALPLGLVGAFLCNVVAAAFLAPLHALRYGRIMRRLAATLDALAPEAAMKMHWMAGAPGALAITPLATMLLVDRSTDYRVISLADEEIVAVDHHVEEDMRMTTRRGPAWTLGLSAGRGLFGAWTFGGRTVTEARVTRSNSVILRYRREDDREIRCTIIPFGPDGIGAENLRLALGRIRTSTLT